MKQIGHVVGILVALVGLGFVVRELVRNSEDVLLAVSGADPWVLFAAVMLGLASMTSIGLAWRRCLANFGVERPILTTLRSYFVGQLGKYVPGGIWPVVGRAEMARRDGVGGVAAYGSTVLSMVLTYLAAILTALGAFLAQASDDSSAWWWPILGLLPLGVFALHPFFMGRGLAILQRVTRRELDLPLPSWGTSVLLLLRHVPAWLGIGGATWLVAYTLDSGVPDFRNLLFATSLSWVVGFIAIGVPGGIGVREAIFLATATSLSSAGVAAAVTVLARILFLGVDLSGALIATLVGRRHSDDATARQHDDR